MLRIATVLILLWSSTVSAGVINVEFKFTPFTGDPSADQVGSVPGLARVFLNNVPVADQEITAGELPVLFEEREVAASVWVPVESLGPTVRKGKNKIRIEFTPTDAKMMYSARFRWALVMDEATEESGDGKVSSTNMSGTGGEEKSGPGPVVFEREFDADFAVDLPWHHYPPVAELNAADRTALEGLLKARIDAFKPDFAGIYAILSANRSIDLEEVKKLKCLDKVHAAGLRVAAAPADRIEFITTGGPEVVIRSMDDMLFSPEDISVLQKITDENLQMCASMALLGVFPPRLVAVKAPSGGWEIAY